MDTVPLISVKSTKQIKLKNVSKTISKFISANSLLSDIQLSSTERNNQLPEDIKEKLITIQKFLETVVGQDEEPVTEHKTKKRKKRSLSEVSGHSNKKHKKNSSE